MHKRVSSTTEGFPFAGDIDGNFTIGKSRVSFELSLDRFWQ